MTYSQAAFRRYGSPIRNCKKCGMRYADPRIHEIAIEGIPEDIFRISSYVILLIIGALILYRGVCLFGRHQLGVSDAIQWMLPSVFTIGGAVMVVDGIWEIISIVTGLKKKRFDKRREESEQRLADKSYVYMLRDLGYDIPEKYL